MIYVSAPLAELATARADLEKHYLSTLDSCGDLGDRVRGGSRAERIRTTPDQPNTFRASHGPGWALVGDAGVVMDSISAQGITNALQDAQRLAEAIATGLGGERTMSVALDDHQQQRDGDIRAMYEFTTRLARFATQSPAERALLTAIARRPGEADRFLGAFAGITPVDEYFSPRHAMSIIGPMGLLGAGIQTAHQLTTSRILGGLQRTLGASKSGRSGTV
jgi:2-polyprenyl-6-methoxyphenol hydroxylase-like FAD-dependent oxidoreductase